MICPNCSSENIQKLSFVYESGLSHIETRTRGSGVGVGFGGGGLGVGVGVGGGRTKGTQISATAAKAAPPQRKKVVAAFIIALIGAFMLLGSLQHPGGGTILALGVAAIAGWVFYSNSQFNAHTFPVLWQRWDASYMCNRCGSIGVPASQELRAVEQTAAPAIQTLEHEPVLAPPAATD